MADEALELARRLDNRACEALVLETRAWFMVEDGDEAGAIELAVSGVEVAASRPTAAFAAWVANLVVNLLRRRGRFDEAFAVLDKVDDLSPEGLGLYEANLRYQRGNVHRALGHVDEARHWFEVALASAHRTASLYGMSMAEWGLGMLARREGDWGEAARRFRSSHDAQLRIGGRDWTTTAASLTEAELCLGHLDTSLQLLAETERLAALDDNVASWAQYHFAAGQMRRAQGRRAEARAHFDRVLEMAPSIHWSTGLVDTLHHLAEMADEDDDSAAAADYRSRAAAVPRR
jgi:tetratricopeptide (TPR) repeat protein